jgi:hypothetical protein
MTGIGTRTTDGTTLAPLLAEVRLAEAAWRDGELPPLTAAERAVLRTARRLLRRSRRRDRLDRLTAADARRVESAAGSTFAHRVDAGALR